jgi:hypothetical protein
MRAQTGHTGRDKAVELHRLQIGHPLPLAPRAQPGDRVVDHYRAGCAPSAAHAHLDARGVPVGLHIALEYQRQRRRSYRAGRTACQQPHTARVLRPTGSALRSVPDPRMFTMTHRPGSRCPVDGPGSAQSGRAWEAGPAVAAQRYNGPEAHAARSATLSPTSSRAGGPCADVQIVHSGVDL